MSYSDKVVVVTGSGSGMGRAMVSEFAAQGARVAALGRRLETVREAAGQVAKEVGAHDRVLAVAVDVRDPASVERGVTEVVSQWGRIDLLCNNAGVLDSYTPAHEVHLDEWHDVIATNLTGPFLMARAVIPQMLEQGAGAIINTSSTSGFSAAGGGTPYTASKHGVIGLTRQLSFEYGARGIRVNAICPGATATPMAMPRDGQEVVTDEALRKTPAQRLCQPGEIAKLAAFLGSEDADFVHGSSYVIDGGWLTAARDQF